MRGHNMQGTFVSPLHDSKPSNAHLLYFIRQLAKNQEQKPSFLAKMKVCRLQQFKFTLAKCPVHIAQGIFSDAFANQLAHSDGSNHRFTGGGDIRRPPARV